MSILFLSIFDKKLPQRHFKRNMFESFLVKSSDIEMIITLADPQKSLGIAHYLRSAISWKMENIISVEATSYPGSISEKCIISQLDFQWKYIKLQIKLTTQCCTGL